MHGNDNFDKNIRKKKAAKFLNDAVSDENTKKRNKFKEKRKDVREDPIFRYRNGHET